MKVYELMEALSQFPAGQEVVIWNRNVDDVFGIADVDPAMTDACVANVCLHMSENPIDS